MEIYHESSVTVKKPEIIIGEYNSDFYHSFYCIFLEKQVIWWAARWGDGFFINDFFY